MGRGDAAGNDNYYATRVFRDPLQVTKLNYRSAPRYEVGWYRRDFVIPNNEALGRQARYLTLAPADFFTDGWCNGTHLGHHEGGYTPFEFDLTDSLTTTPEGTRVGTVVLRVCDPMDNHEQPVGKQWQWYTTTSGIWQTVYVEPRSTTYIDSFRIVPDLGTRSAQFLIHCTEATDCTVDIEITPPKGSARTTSITVIEDVAEGWTPVDPMFLWDPNEPNLYRVVMHLRCGERVLDEVCTYFGMRSIDAAPIEANDPNSPQALRINNVPRYLRGALYQSYYPEGVYTAGDAQVLRDDIAYAKKAGFNFLRVHIKIDDPLLLYYADTMGMMLMCDFPNFGEGGDTPLGRERFETMMRKAIQRDFNHPSFVAWCLFNETWGFGGQVELVKLFPSLDENPEEVKMIVAESPESEVVAKAKLENHGSHAWVQHIWEEAKVLDNTRLIEDMSVVYWDHLHYFGHGDTDINSWHFYIDDYVKAKKHIEKIVNETYSGSNFNYVEGYEHRNQPLINSEYGGVGALDGDRDTSWSFQISHQRVASSGQNLRVHLHRAERRGVGIQRLLKYDRSPKQFGYDPTIINAANVLPVDAPPISRCPMGEIMRLEVASSHYSTKPLKDISLVWQLSGVDTLGRVHPDLARGLVPIAFPHGRVAHAHTIELKLPDEVMHCTLSLRAISRTGDTVARNYIEYLTWNDYPARREETPQELILRMSPGDWADAWWSGFSGDREDAHHADRCFGSGHGFFEWAYALDGANLWEAKRIRVLVEASARRVGNSQTDNNRRPTNLQILLNGAPVYSAKVPDHPHDSRGSLSYINGGDTGRGAYGYLAHATIEGALLRDIVERVHNDHLYLRTQVPGDMPLQGGLTVYGAQSGRYPVAPTIIIEW
jgi:hypothetical protein